MKKYLIAILAFSLAASVFAGARYPRAEILLPGRSAVEGAVDMALEHCRANGLFG
jgi:hypothetical protein